MQFIVQYLTKEEIINKAHGLLEEVGLVGKVIECDYILDSVFDIQTVPAPGLYNSLSVAAFLAGGFKFIYADEDTLNGDPGWCNFSLGHEIGHVILHDTIFRSATHTTRSDYERFRGRFSDGGYDLMEKQAETFSRGLICHQEILEIAASEAVEKASSAGIKLTHDLNVYWPFIFNGIAKKIQANELSVKFRMKELELIDRFVTH